MKNFQRIIVALDHTVFDEKLIRYFDRFCQMIQPEKVHFIYVDHDLELPPGMEIIYNDDDGNTLVKDELLKKALQKKIATGFSPKNNVQVSIDVLEGEPLEEILHWVNVKQADLLVVGNKKMSEGSGVVAKRVARHTDCAVLFVPETGRERIEKILVPVDFSDYSKVAMQGAIDLAMSGPGRAVTVFNTFSVSLTGNPGINLSYDKFVHDMTAYKKEALAKYIAGFDGSGVKLDTAVAVNETGNPARQIYHYAVKNSYDLIVVGAKGHNMLERVLMGSVTEKLLGLDKEIPVLVLRK